MTATEREKIGQPLDGREAWKVGDVYSNGAPFKFINAALADYSVSRWYDNNWAIFLKGSVVRGRLNGMRLFKSAQAAAAAAEKHHAARVAAVREINEMQRASECRAAPSHDRSA